MAEGVLFDLGKEVLKVVGSLALQEIKLASGVKAELENLKSTVSTIQAVLLDAEKQGSHNNEVKDWLKKLRDVFLDADDVLDDFSTEALQHKVMTGSKMTKEVRIFFSSSNQLAFSLKMGHRIKEIRERLSIIAKDKDDFHFIQNSVEPQVMNRDRETYSFVLEEDVVGREDDKNKIIILLLDSNTVENVSIIPIVGIGGLGKTTLAQLIYNDEIVKNNFELKLWICVSDNFDLKHIVKQILESLGNRRDEESLEILQNNLRGKLNGKKYFIVLDDLWNEDKIKWIPLKNLLMGGARGSKIVVTTRSIKVAEITGTTSPHKLKGLDLEKSWSLFVKMAFKEGKEPEYQGIVDLGKTIVGKCIGVPLAIRTIGSLLYGKTYDIEWQSFLENELSKLTQQENDISLTFKLSYDHLPSHLKQCFAYCRLFSKDYRIDVNTLINLWVAQGFIVLEDPRQRFMDIGRNYFMELLWRSFFQDVENDELGNIKSCKMHDLMHDLATLVSGSESVILNSSGENDIEKVRHVSFDLEDSSRKLSIFKVKGMKIRTVLAASVGRKLGNLTCDALISNLNYLRTLDLSCLGLHVVPHSIGELKHLRYLDLSENTSIEFLPDSITKLLNLLVLKVSRCSSLEELPQRLKNLVNLRHLDISNCDKLTHMPLGLGHLTSLEILPLFVVTQEDLKASSCNRHNKKQARSDGGLSELKELSNLGGSLVIKNVGHGEDDVVECKATNMKDKQHLQELKLRWKDIRDDGETECYDEMSLEGLQPHPNLKSLEVWYYMGVRIPSWVSSLTNLVKFELSYNRRLQHLPPLNQLPFLKFVELWGMEALEYIEYIWIDEDSVSNVLGASSSSSSSSSSKTPFFPSLSSLSISRCPKLKGWWRNSDDDNEPHHLLLPSFPPSLSKLEIVGCPNLTYMPPFPYLKERLRLSGCSWKVLEQTMKMGAATTSTYFPPLSQLQELHLDEIRDFESLPEEGLRNLVSLRELYIRSCYGLVSFPWIGSLTSLQTLEIGTCDNLTSLPQDIRNLTSLKRLRIDEMPALEYISDEESVSNVLGASSSSSSKTPFFPSLSSLKIWDCPKLKGWWRNSDDDNEPHHLLLTSFPPSLSDLQISNCPNLTSMPPIPYLKERLILTGCSWKVLEQTMKMKMGAATTSTYFPLSQLQTLKLEDIYGFESLPEEWLRNLVSLRELYIQSCDGLVSLAWIGSLTSLQTLHIWRCHNLTSLPQEIRNLTSLKKLRIVHCPLLGQRCKRQIGEDWPFIAHVQLISVDGEEETISSEPCDAEPSNSEPYAEPSDAEPTEAKNKLGYKIRTLFKTCNCATGQELSES